MIFLDLKKFSEINRKHGMATGDQFLLNYASSFTQHLDPDEILGRAYGNLFIAIVKKERLPIFVKLLENMNVTVTEGDLLITESIGARAGISSLMRARRSHLPNHREHLISFICRRIFWNHSKSRR